MKTIINCIKKAVRWTIQRMNDSVCFTPTGIIPIMKV